MGSLTKEICDLIIDTHRGYGWRAEREALFSPRRIDVLAIGPGGVSVIAYEVKVSRTDFRNELKDPDKRATVIANSSEFYFVTPKDLIGHGEVPLGCGLIYFENGWLYMQVAAERKSSESVFERRIREYFERKEKLAEQAKLKYDEDTWENEQWELEHAMDESHEHDDVDVVLPGSPSRDLGWLRNWMFPVQPLKWSRMYLEVFAELDVNWIAMRPEFDFDQVPF